MYVATNKELTRARRSAVSFSHHMKWYRTATPRGVETIVVEWEEYVLPDGTEFSLILTWDLV